MNFRAAVERLGSGGLSGDMEMSADPIGAEVNLDTDQRTMQPDPKTDASDPASPGGASPYNGAPPFGQPVSSDPEWRNPQEGPHSNGPVPYLPGPGVDTTTIHDARRASYEAKADRYGAR